MKNRLQLVIDQQNYEEKRIFPRFPYYFLTFRSEGKTYEVRDISYNGLNLKLREGDNPLPLDTEVMGNLRWSQHQLSIIGTVRWATGDGVGLEFVADTGMVGRVKEFLSVKNLAQTMRPLHHPKLGLDLPASLKYWIKGDAPVELFVWCHPDGAFSAFQLIILDSFVEWKDGHGILSGKVLWEKAMDTPLSEEGEYTLLIDYKIDNLKRELANSLLDHLPPQTLPEDCLAFLKLKLGF